MLSTSPSSTRSVPIAKTIGIVDVVAAFVARKCKTPKPGHRSRGSLSSSPPRVAPRSPVETVESVVVERPNSPSCGAVNISTTCRGYPEKPVSGVQSQTDAEKADRSRKAASQVPQSDRAVSGAGEQQVGAGALAEGDAVDAVAMPCQF